MKRDLHTAYKRLERFLKAVQRRPEPFYRVWPHDDIEDDVLTVEDLKTIFKAITRLDGGPAIDPADVHRLRQELNDTCQKLSNASGRIKELKAELEEIYNEFEDQENELDDQDTRIYNLEREILRLKGGK